jgi:hypothetical protein
MFASGSDARQEKAETGGAVLAADAEYAAALGAGPLGPY